MNPCVENVIAHAAGELSERDAGKLIRDLTNKAKAVAQADGIPLPDAAAKVVNDHVQFEKMKQAMSVRATMVNLRAIQNFEGYVTGVVNKGGIAGNGVRDYLANAYNMAHFYADKTLSRMVAALQEKGLLSKFQNGGEALSRDVTTERWNLSGGKPFTTDNKVAQEIAKIIVPIRKELNAKLRKFGANIADEQTYAGPQTHDPDLLRRAGMKPGIISALWGKENMDEAFRVWRGYIDTLKIDWVKTEAGTTEQEKNKFLKDFFTAIYSGKHDSPNETIAPDRFTGYGSLAEKIQSQRLLWFADAESQWKYNQRWGIRDFNTSIIAEIKQGHRALAMLQTLGASPENVFKNGISRIEQRVDRLSNSQEQINSLRKANIQGSFDLLAGRAGTTRNPWRSMAFTALKDVVLAGKGGSILWSMTADAAYLNSEMAAQGFGALDRLASPMDLKLLGTAEGKRYLQDIGFLSHSLSGLHAERWSNDVRPTNKNFFSKLSEWTFKLGGVTWLTDKERMGIMHMTSKKLGEEAHLPLDEINPRTRAILDKYQFTSAEWDVMRSMAYDVAGVPVITPDKMAYVPDEVINKLLTDEYKTATPTNRDRRRLDLESKLGAYIRDRSLSGVPQPGLKEKELMSLHATPRGEWSREFADLFFVFKGFPITVAMRNAEKWNIISGNEGKGAAFRHIAATIAETVALGYLGLTARELLQGKEPRKLVQDGAINWKLALESAAKGGGIGIYGDWLLNQYDTDTRSFIRALSGPVIGDLDPVFAMISKGRQALYDEHGDRMRETLPHEAERLAESYVPLMNLWYTKFFMDQFVLWHLREALSPGVLRRRQRFDQQQNWQEWWMDPVTN